MATVKDKVFSIRLSQAEQLFSQRSREKRYVNRSIYQNDDDWRWIK